MLLEWESPAGRCALSLDQKVGAGGTILLLILGLPLNDSSVNAFAMPTGYVVVHRGLIEKAVTAND